MFTPKLGRGRGRGGPSGSFNSRHNLKSVPERSAGAASAVKKPALVRATPGEGRSSKTDTFAGRGGELSKEEAERPHKEYKIVRGSIGNETDATHIIRFQGRHIPIDKISHLKMERKVDPNYVRKERVVEELPESGAGSVFRSKNKIGKVKRRWRSRGEREMLWEMKLEQQGIVNKYDGQKERIDSHYMLFVNDGKGNFEAIPTDNWYKFTQEIKYETLSLEEAEAKMKNKKSSDRWIMNKLKQRDENVEEEKARSTTAMARNTGANSDSSEEDTINDPLDRVTKHGQKMAKKAEGKRRVEREDMEYEAEFTDDEEGAVPTQILEETEDYEPAPESDSDEGEEVGEPNEDELTKGGKELRKILHKNLDDVEVPESQTKTDDSDDELGVVIQPKNREDQANKDDTNATAKRNLTDMDEGKTVVVKKIKREVSIAPFTEEDVCRLLSAMPNSSLKDILGNDKKIKKIIAKDKNEKQRFIEIMNKVATKTAEGANKTYALKKNYKDTYRLA
eukprot:CFRG8519T1